MFCGVIFLGGPDQVRQLLMQLLPDILAAWMRVAQPNQSAEHVLQLQVMPGRYLFVQERKWWKWFAVQNKGISMDMPRLGSAKVELD